MPVQQSPTHRPPTTEADIALRQKQRQKKTDQGHTQEHPVALTPRPQRQRQRVVRHSAFVQSDGTLEFSAEAWMACSVEAVKIHLISCWLAMRSSSRSWK